MCIALLAVPIIHSWEFFLIFSVDFPANIYLFKSTVETLEKGMKYVPS